MRDYVDTLQLQRGSTEMENKADRDKRHEQQIEIAALNREMCVSLFKARHNHEDIDYLDERIESLLCQICEITGENMDNLYWELDGEAYD
jgi:hypothetical protein